MGFDLIGLQPRNRKGGCFSVNIWSWHRLADFVLLTCSDVFRDAETRYWRTNDGQRVGRETALKVAKRLKQCLEDDNAYRFTHDWKAVKAFAEFCENSGGFEIW